MKRLSTLAAALTIATTAFSAAPALAKRSQEPPPAQPQGQAENDIPADYTLGKEDVVDVSVFGFPQLDGPQTVRPDGKITLKLVGDVQAEGRTIQEITDDVTEKLKPFIPAPHVTIAMKQINSMKVYVVGRVGAPGVFNIGSPVTLLQALAMAKGFTPWAHKSHLTLVRGVTGKRVSVNYDHVVSGKQENYTLYPGDTIVVP